jgi:hypothetical protein
MPAINPNNYNIDFFSTYSFGDITDTSYLSYLFQQNLTEIAPELINSPAGNFQDVYNTEKGLEKDINYTSISNPGSIDEWLLGDNFPVSLLEQAYQNPSQGVGANQYGPSTLQTFDYENPDLIVEDTGYIGYPTSVGGGIVNNILTEGLDAVGLGGLNSFLIDFDSPLNDIAKERRLEEAKNRVKDGIIENTIGRINLDPLGLLSGQPLFGKDYKITKPAGGLLGGAINLLSDVAGVEGLKNLIGGDLPDGAFDWDSPLDDPFSINTIDISKKLLERTGSGQKSALFDSLQPNKYGPIIEGQNDPIDAQPKAEDTKQPTQKGGYLAYGEIIKNAEQKAKEEARESREQILNDLTFNDSPFTDKLGTRPPISFNNAKKSAKDITGGLSATDEIVVRGTNKSRNSRADVPIEPTEAENPSINSLTTVDKLKFQGFEFDRFGIESDYTYDNIKTSWDYGHDRDWQSLRFFVAPAVTLGPEPTAGTEGGNDGAEPGPQVFRGELYWQDGVTDNLPKRGILNYTQKLINKSTNVPGTAARFIGMPNSDQNYELKGDGTDRRHVQMSMGNLVKDVKRNADGEQPYCRSWSVRNAYNKYDNLIRNDALWREFRAGTVNVAGEKQAGRKFGSYSTLREPGIPKIAYEYDDLVELDIKRARIDNRVGKLKSITPDPKYVIPYMFSIENLAWKDSPHWHKLPNCEQGPHGGRIMWFPPYNINFTDNTSVNWDTTSFIGRAEPIYTYNNTERTGTLSFTIVVDHPSVINAIKDEAFSTTRVDENGEETTVSALQNLETFFAGCSTEEIREIMNKVPEIIPPDDIPDEEIIPPDEIEIPDPVEVKDSLQFHFKNARGISKKEGGTEDGYQDRGGYQAALTTNSSCKGKIVGRCFDYNYESTKIEWYDNPRLYKGAVNNYGSQGECPLGGLVINDFNEENLVVIPAGGTTTRPLPPPCKGYGSKQSPVGSDFKPFGPNPTISQKLQNGEITDKSRLWLKDSDGNAYKQYNYCCDLGLTGYTSGSTTFTNFSELGFYEFREGANQCFWGTAQYPFANNFGQKPILDLPAKDYEYKFTVSEGPGGPAGTGIAQLMEFLTCTPEGKAYTIVLDGNCSNFGDEAYNQKLGEDRYISVYKWMRGEMEKMEEANGGPPKLSIEGVGSVDLYSEKNFKENQKGFGDKKYRGCQRWEGASNGKDDASNTGMVGDNSLDALPGQSILTPGAFHPTDYENVGASEFRRVDIKLVANKECLKEYYDAFQKAENERAKNLNEELARQVEEKRKKEQADFEKEKELAKKSILNMVNECDYFMKIKEEDSFLYENLKDKLKNFHPAFHSITPEGFNKRITFLQQCGRQGPSFIDPNQPQNTAFGRPPICILRLGDFYFTKIVIDSINFTFDPLQWDLNPEGIGVQPMLVNVDLNFKFIGGSTLQGPLTQLQNAVSYNFFANTAVYMPLEKILTKRGKAGELLVEGLDDNFNEGTDNRTYYYGPWASQQEFNQTLMEEEAVDQIRTSDDAANEDVEEEFIEQNLPVPCPGGKGRVLTNEEVIQNSPPNRTSISDTEPEGTFYISAESLADYPLEDYYWVLCDGSAPDPVPRESANPLNQEVGEDNTQTEQQQEETQGNAYNEDLEKIFYPTNPNEITAGSLRGQKELTNKYGKIEIFGDAFRDTSAGEGSLFESGFDLLGGIIPKYVYGMLDSRFNNFYTFFLTEIKYGSDLSSGEIIGVSNAGYVFNGESRGSDSTISETGTKQVASFNVFYDLTGYLRFEDWKESYKNGEDFVIEDMETTLEDDEKVEFQMNYIIGAAPTELGKEEGFKTQVFGKINVKGFITKEGFERLKELLSDS